VSRLLPHQRRGARRRRGVRRTQGRDAGGSRPDAAARRGQPQEGQRLSRRLLRPDRQPAGARQAHPGLPGMRQVRTRAFWIPLALLLLAPAVAMAQTQGLFDAASGKLDAVGWAGFRDTKFISESVGALVLAIALGAVIGFHPTTRRTVDRLSEIDMPKVFIMYAFI